MLHHYARRGGKRHCLDSEKGIVAPYCCVGNVSREMHEEGQWGMTNLDVTGL